MPLLRYRTGDLARLESGPCACGSLLPRLGRVDGRRENNLPLGAGQTLSIHRLDEVLFSIPTVRAFEAGLRRENDRNTLFLAVEAEGALDEAALAARLPANLDVRFHYTEVSPFSCRGKRRIHSRDEQMDAGAAQIHTRDGHQGDLP